MRFSTHTIMVPIVYLITISAFTANAGPPKNIREPAVSGTFYPGSASMLKAMISVITKRTNLDISKLLSLLTFKIHLDLRDTWLPGKTNR